MYWHPVDFAKVENGKARFCNVGKGCIFLPVYYSYNGEQIPVSDPILLDWDGNVKNLKADMKHSKAVFRKGPLLEYAWQVAVMMENGKFEASNDKYFKNAIFIGDVQTPADQAGEIKIMDNIGAYRYWRYVQYGDTARCYLGEMTVLSKGKDITQNATVIGNFDKTYGGVLENGLRAFDGDVLIPVSFSHSKLAWVGLDFGEPVNVDMIRYVPRSDGDMIEPNDEYDLLYWHENKWMSLKRKTATSISIEFDNVPMGTIYLLRDLTKGSSERIFTISSSGDQIWW